MRKNIVLSRVQEETPLIRRTSFPSTVVGDRSRSRDEFKKDRLQVAICNSAARIVSNTRKFDRGLTHFRRSQLHWLDVVDRVRFRIRVYVQVTGRCSDVCTRWLLNTCLPISKPSPASLAVTTCDWLTVVNGHLDFPRVKLASYGGRSFAYAGPSNWNSLPAYLRDAVVFLFHLLSATSKPFSSLSTRLAHAARLGFFYKNALYKFTVIIIT